MTFGTILVFFPQYLFPCVLSLYTFTCSAHIFVHSENLYVLLTASPNFPYCKYTEHTAKTRSYAILHSTIIPSLLGPPSFPGSARKHLSGTIAFPDILTLRTKYVCSLPLVLTLLEIIRLDSGSSVHYLDFLTQFYSSG